MNRDVDAAVHATELQQRAGGAVVVPQASDPTLLGGLKPADVPLQVAGENSELMLSFRMGKVRVTAVGFVLLMCAWCAYLMTPHEHIKFDAKMYSIGYVVYYADYIDKLLSPVRSLLSMWVGGSLGLIVVVAFVPSRIRTNEPRRLRSLLLRAIPFAVGLPFTSLTTQFDSVNYILAVGPEDLGKHSMLVDNTSTWVDFQVGSKSSNIEVGSASSDFQVGSASMWSDVEVDLLDDITTRISTADTILRRVMLPPRNQVRSCSIRDDQRGNEYTNVAYDFMTNDWQLYVLSYGVLPVDMYAFPRSSSTSGSMPANRSFTSVESTLIQSLFTRAVYLYADAALSVDVSQSGSNSAALEQLKVDTIAYAAANATTDPDIDNLELYVRNYFTSFPAWEEVLNAIVSEIDVEYSTFNLTDNVQFSSVSLNIPLTNSSWHRELAEVNGELVEQATQWSGAGDVEYQIDVSNECGPLSCGVQNRGLASEPKVVAYGDCSENGGFDCTGETRNTSMWLAGFGRRIEGDSLELLDSTDPKLRKAILRNPREYHRVTMGYLTFELEDLAEANNAECRAESCLGLSFRSYYDPTSFTTKALLVGHNNTPMIDFGSSFDFQENIARGRPLVTRYTTGAIVEYEILRPQNFDAYKWSDVLKADNCSGRMERSIITSELNHLFMENSLQTTYTAGFFFLFQSARPTAFSSASDGEVFLELLGSNKTYSVSLIVPKGLGMAGLVFGGLYLLTLVYVLQQNEKVITEYASARLHDTSVLVRALADTKRFPKKYIELSVKPPGKNAVSSSLRGLGISSIEFGPLPASSGSTVGSVVIRQGSQSNKALKDLRQPEK